MRTKTEIETVTRFGIDPPMTTAPSIQIQGFPDAIQHVGAPAFGSTIMFLTTAIAVFLSTAAVTYLLLQSKGPIRKVYSGKPAPQQNPEQDKKLALEYARMVTICHVLVILVLVIRTREGLVTLAPVAYEVCALILGIEAAICLVGGCVWVVVKGVEYGEVGGKAKGA